MNNVALVGRLASDPVLEFPHGNAVCTFQLAVERANGTDVIPISCLGAPAEQHANHLTEGRLVSVIGRIRQLDDPDRVAHEVIGTRIIYLDSLGGETLSDLSQPNAGSAR